MNFYAYTALAAVTALFIISIVTLIKGKRNDVSRVFVLFNIFVGFWALGCFIESTTNSFDSAYFADRILYTGAIFTPVIYFHLILILTRTTRKKLVILYSGYVISFAFLLFNLTPALRPFFIGTVKQIPGFRFISVPNTLWYVYLLYYNFFGAYTLYIIFKAYRTVHGLAREQLKYFFISTALLATGGILYFGLVFGTIRLPIDNFFTISYSLITSYAIIKYRLIDIRIILTRAGILVFVYALMVGIPFWYGANTGHWFIVSISVAALSSIGPFVYLSLKNKAENILLAEQKRYHNILVQASAGMVKEHSIDHLMKLIAYILKRTVGMRYAAVFLDDKEKQMYTFRAARGAAANINSLHFNYSHPFVEYMKTLKEPFVYEELPERIRTSLKNIPGIGLIVPSFIQDKLLGFLILGNKFNNTVYSKEDISVFVTLANQAALAVENCLFMEEFQHTQERLFTAEKLALIGGMADGLAHQIKNRLNQFSLASGEIGLECKEIIDDFDKLNNDKKLFLEKLYYLVKCSDSINDNIKKTNGVIQGILNFARTERKETFFGEFPIKEVIDQCVNLLRVKHQITDFPLSLSFDDSAMIFGVKPQILECILNTLDNAYEAIKEKMDYRLDETGKKEFVPLIKISLGKGEKSCIISIADNGVGIKEEDKMKVFGAFFTTKPSSKSGSGIGAYVVRRMIEENHKGRIWFESEYMKGTTFHMELPLKDQVVQ